MTIKERVRYWGKMLWFWPRLWRGRLRLRANMIAYNKSRWPVDSYEEYK